MRPVPFTQYLLPDGRPRAAEIDVGDATHALAVELMAHGFVFEAEILGEGSVSLECVANLGGEPWSLASELVPNGPEVPIAVERMIARAHRAICR